MEISSIVFSAASIGGLGLLFGLGLGVAAKKFAVKIDPLIPLVRDALPSANCGACGFAGCDAFAKAVVEGHAPTNGCPVGGKECAERVAAIMGVDAVTKERTTAFVKCNGSCDNAKQKYEYYGVVDCRDEAYLQGGGSKTCSYGCLGGGSCVKACMFDAINIVDGIAVIDEEKCTSCGMCVATCPKNLIEIIPAAKTTRVVCNSQDKGKDVKAACSVGCIGCRMCFKACEYDAIIIDGTLAKVDYEKCVLCNACRDKCPTKAIVG